MKRRIPCLPALLFCGLIFSGAAGYAQGEEIPLHIAADPNAPPVTAESLLENDRFWPFRARLLEPWTPPGAEKALPPIPAVLIRVASKDTLRLDFGRRGRHDVPAALTDVVERANRVRLGEIEKMAPNLILTIGNKLIRVRGDVLDSHHITRDARYDGILCVFADPAAGSFAALAKSLEGIDARHHTATILFPQGEFLDRKVGQRLHQLGWDVPFVMKRMSEPFRRSIASEKAPLPHVMLLTQEGRVLYRGAPPDDFAAKVSAILPARAQLEQAASR